MILAGIFLILVVYFTYRFLLPSATTPAKVIKFAPAFVLFGLLFLLVALFSVSDWMTALSPRNLSPITTIADLQKLTPSGDTSIRVLLVGKAPPIGTDILSRFEMIDGAVELSLHKNFVMIDAIASETAVLLGRLGIDGLVAEVIYFGTVESYFSFLERYTIIPILTIFLSVLGALITWFIPIWQLWQVKKLNHAKNVME
ncbi:MAG: hypothetical protein SFZ02_00135 [bacterium]|nr:hypothetical protein [bacterium]